MDAPLVLAFQPTYASGNPTPRTFLRARRLDGNSIALGLKRTVFGSVIGLLGLLVVTDSVLGILGNLEEWGAHFCSSPQPYPVCASIVWLIAELGGVASLGVAMVVVGLYLAAGKAEGHEKPVG